jgi:hypothetical protein
MVTNKEDEGTVLMEGGLPRSASSKFYSSPIKTNLIRFLTLEDSFLLENRATLRAMAEFGAILLYFYICDRTSLIGQSQKVPPSNFFDEFPFRLLNFKKNTCAIYSSLEPKFFLV